MRQKYTPETTDKIRKLRSKGYTYREIISAIGIKIPKSTLSFYLSEINLPQDYAEKVNKLNTKSIELAWEVNRRKRKTFLDSLKQLNNPIAQQIHNYDTAKIALAMLCLGEASKYSATRRAFTFGSSDVRIITIFLNLMRKCFDFRKDKIRCTVQCRADQDIPWLENYWQKATHIPKRLFYATRVDPRTIGKPTTKKDYKGVLRIDYLDTKVQLELESLADLVYNMVQGPVA